LQTDCMLIYCYEPVGLSFEAAAPAVLRAIESEQVRQTLARVDPEKLMNRFGKSPGKLGLGAVRIGEPTAETGRVAIPIQWPTEDPSAISMTGEVTLSRLLPALCHLSMNSSLTGRLATGLMYNRSFQMSVELAAAEFLDRLAGSVLVLAPANGTA
jgi:hypothetical protein